MFNNVVGNLSPEWCNQYINSCQFHRSKFSLKLGYIRADIVMMSVNIMKFKYWKHWLMENYNPVCTEMNKLVQQVTQLQFLNKNKSLVPEIPQNKSINEAYIQQKVLKHSLRFQYKWHKWGISENEKLLNYLCNKSENWILNEKELNLLYIYFDKKFSKDILQKKCFKYGCDYKS